MVLTRTLGATLVVDVNGRSHGLLFLLGNKHRFVCDIFAYVSDLRRLLEFERGIFSRCMLFLFGSKRKYKLIDLLHLKGLCVIKDVSLTLNYNPLRPFFLLQPHQSLQLLKLR